MRLPSSLPRLSRAFLNVRSVGCWRACEPHHDCRRLWCVSYLDSTLQIETMIRPARLRGKVDAAGQRNYSSHDGQQRVGALIRHDRELLSFFVHQFIEDVALSWRISQLGDRVANLVKR